MDIRQTIVSTLAQSDAIVNAYLADLTPGEILVRPVEGANHIAWQLGHLIYAERYLVDQAVPGKMEPLPDGFAERHSKATADRSDAASFLSKEAYQGLAKKVRANALRVLDGLSPADLDRPVSGGLPPFVTTVGGVFFFLGTHALMHAGQWAVIRRKLGRAPLF